MGRLLDRGVRQFKFVDRTFNLNLNISSRILQFFLDRWQRDLFLHFEMIPDRLPLPLRDLIAQFPPAGLQLEVGIQTFNEEVGQRISRRQDNKKVAENFTFLRNHTGVHLHADLIVGLPGEDIQSFGHGFDRLVALRPQEIQVGMLKRLRGTPIARHDHDWGMVYSPHPPYEILQTAAIDFTSMQRLRRFSRYWDLIANSGNFVRCTQLLAQDASCFERFMQLSEHLHARAGRSHGIALLDLAEMIFEFLVKHLDCDTALAVQAVAEDYHRGGRSDVPAFLRGHVAAPDTRRPVLSGAPRRQARHLGAQSLPQ